MKADLLIHCATSGEMGPFLKQYPPDTDRPLRPCGRVLSGKIDQKAYVLVLSGPGVFNTLCAMTAVLGFVRPALILQTGISGVFEQAGGTVGDIAVATSDRYIHTGTLSDQGGAAPLPFDLIPGVSTTRRGIYDFNTDLTEHLLTALAAVCGSNGPKISSGRFITVSMITGSRDQAQERYDLFMPLMEAMEGAACAHAACLFGIPVLEARSASNITGVTDKSRWDIQGAARQIVQICKAVSGL